MRVLVCGGRDFKDRSMVYRGMDSLVRDNTPISVVITGGAGGADYFGRCWAEICDIDIMTFRADWERQGKAAGPIRNQRMIDEGKPDIVIAFPGGRGTADMVRRAKAAGIEVREIA
jgi:hypothetical protein